MPLKGGLNELALLDILQVVAFSKKTGHLLVKSPLGMAGVVFKDGLVLCAYSPMTIDFLREIKGPVESKENQAFILEQIQIALREIIALKVGTFEFKLTKELPTHLDDIDLSSIFLTEGVNPQGLLLNLAKEMDDERRDTTDLLVPSLDEVPALDTSIPPPEVSSASPPEPSRGDLPPVVLVDDEEMVTRIVAAELMRNGYEVVTASGPSEGLSAVRSLSDNARSVVLVTDLRMPTTTGKSFLGGLELVRNLRRDGLRLPVVLMAEKLTPKTRAYAKKLGIRQVALKPALSKLDPEQYGADLQSFAEALEKQLQEACIESDDATTKKKRNRAADILDFLTTMTGRLMHPGHKGEISGAVLTVATKFFDRGILFLLKKNQAHGLGGFGLAETTQASFKLAREISVDINQVAPFAEVVHSKSTRRFHDLAPFEKSLYDAVGRGRSRECILVPMLNNQEVLAVLYGDNAATGRPLGKLRGLELFIAQAGMALENLSLHRKLSLFQTKFLPRKRNAAGG
jgi:CheY-like chemotaxis protein